MYVPETVLTRIADKTPTTRIAVVGASNDRSKFGNIIVRNLKGHGYSVVPINPHETRIADLPVVSDVNALDDPVHIVNVVTPPDVSRRVIESLDPEHAEVVWFQEGSFDQDVVEKAADRFDTVIAGPCIMVEARRV